MTSVSAPRFFSGRMFMIRTVSSGQRTIAHWPVQPTPDHSSMSPILIDHACSNDCGSSGMRPNEAESR